VTPDLIEKEVLHLFYLHRGNPDSAVQESVIHLVNLLLQNQRAEIIALVRKYPPETTPEAIAEGILRNMKC
jgi:hypothetical protein